MASKFYTVRKSFNRNVGLLAIHTTATYGKAGHTNYFRYPRQSHVLKVDGEKFLITNKLAMVGTKPVQVKPYQGMLPAGLVLFYRNLKEAFGL